MCSLNQSISLSESKNAQITWCQCCKVFSLNYNSCCSSFSEDQLDQFKHVLMSLAEHDFKFYFNNEWHVILRTSAHSAGFCLKQEDVENIRTLINKAQNMYEAYQILYS